MTQASKQFLVTVVAMSVATAAIVTLVVSLASDQKSAPTVATVRSAPQTDTKPDLTKDENHPYRPVSVELFQPEYRFEVIGTDVTPGTGLRWILVNRTKDGGRMIFRVLVGDLSGPIERGKVVRLGLAQFWSNPGNLANFVVVLAVE